MEYIYSGFSDIGQRKINQDSYGLQVAQIGSDKVVFSTVCDGVGGLMQGEKSSATVVKYFSSWFENIYCGYSEEIRKDTEYIKNELYSRIESVSSGILSCADSDGIKSGTTVVILLISGGKALVVNVGDSRAYLIRDRRARLISTDHTVVQLKKNENRNFSAKEKNTLYQCLGAGVPVTPDYETVDIKSGDAFMLCTDGVYRKLSENEIAVAFEPKLISDAKQIGITHKMLANKAKARGESDNITAVSVLAK